VDIILDRVYEKEVNLFLENVAYDQQAIVNFISDGFSRTILYPKEKTIKVSEGQYEIQVYVYEDSSFELEATTKQQCVDIPEPGFIGLFGFNREKCFDVKIPSQLVSSALSGGGKQQYYILESELIDSDIIKIYGERLPQPRSIEQLQSNYILFEDKGLDIIFE
jgi:hypothetical protein